ncbi:MAG: hypothetical protein Q4G07_10915, partial [Oscillospiraceae bacterium]|nr:hypothetical protein [Oscillospiraceae bacterium]
MAEKAEERRPWGREGGAKNSAALLGTGPGGRALSTKAGQRPFADEFENRGCMVWVEHVDKQRGK